MSDFTKKDLALYIRESSDIGNEGNDDDVIEYGKSVSPEIAELAKSLKPSKTTIGEKFTIPLMKNLLGDINSVMEFTGGIGKAVVDAFTGNVKNPEPGGLEKVKQTGGEFLSDVNEMTRPIIAPVLDVVPHMGQRPQAVENYIQQGKKEAVSAVMNAPQQAFEHPGFAAASLAPLVPKAISGIERGVSAAVGAKDAMGKILNRASVVKQNLIHTAPLADKAVEQMAKAYSTANNTFGKNLVVLEQTATPLNGINFNFTDKILSEAKYRPLKNLIKRNPIIKDLKAGDKLPGGLNPTQAQEFKNVITSDIKEKILKGEVKATEKEVQKLVDAINKDIEAAYPEYRAVRMEHETTLKNLESLKELGNRDKAIEFVRKSLSRGVDPVALDSLIQTLPKDFGRELLDYNKTYNFLNTTVKDVFTLKDKTIAKQIQKTPKKKVPSGLGRQELYK